jgi:hypothetical protein
MAHRPAAVSALFRIARRPRPALVALGAFAFAALALSGANAQQGERIVRYKAAVVALTDDAELRKSFEDSLVAKAREHDYDAVTSYGIEPNVTRVDRNQFLRALAANGIQAVLMLRPAAIGAGASLESVRGEVSDELLRDMRQFAQQVGSGGSADDLVAVVHMAIYVLRDGDPRLVSSGAVWLDEEVESREQGIERLQELIAANVDAVRPAIRMRLGLPPLP